MNTNMKNKTMNTKVVYRQSLRQRITATVMAIFMLAQICMPAVVAAEVLSNAQITSKVIADIQYQPSTTSDYLYQQASYLGQAIPIQNQTIDSFYKTLVKEKIGLLNPTFIPIAGDITFFIPTYPLGKLLGDNYVQNRFIRSQINDLLGRHLITPDRINDGKFITETDQINELYKNAHDFVVRTGGQYKFGDVLPFKSDQISQDMIWPEIHNINGENVLVPIVYLSQSTINTYGVKGHVISFLSSAEFQSIQLDKEKLLSVRGDLIKAANDITLNGGSIVGTNSLNLFAGGTLNNLSGTISAVDNIKITAAQINNKTIVVPYAFKNGSGTRLGEIAGYSTENGSITLNAYNGDITFEGATATAFGTITFNASNNIIIKTQQTQSQSTGVDGHWQLTNSNVDVVGSKITANETIRLMAGGAIQISGSEIHSTKGGIELLAKQGIYILDELGQTLVQKVDKIGKTQGTASDFNSWAVRSALDAGKGVLLYTDGGDVTLKGADITSTEGTKVTAKNGKVHLLLSKEQSQHYLNTVRKGKWVIKTTTVEEVTETGTPNAIIGGFAVSAMQGVDVEYTGKEGATLAEQIEEYRKMPTMKWMADLYDQNKNNVDWSEVELVYKNIHKTNRSLSPAAMAIIAIAMCVAMGPLGANALAGISSSVAGAVGTGAVASAAGAAVAAGTLTLATSAAQSLAAGNSIGATLNAMDSDENLRSLAISMATAGAMKGLDVNHMEIFDSADVTLNPSLDLVNQGYQAVVSATVSAGVSVTINGGNWADYKNSFTQSLATSAINSLGEKMANSIGFAAKTSQINDVVKYLAHASAGCVLGIAKASAVDSSESNKYTCFSGAGGAVIGEFVAEKYKESTGYAQLEKAEIATREFLAKSGISADVDINTLTDEQLTQLKALAPSRLMSATEIEGLKAQGVDLAKLSAGLAAFVAGANVTIASETGENAAKNNAWMATAIVAAVIAYRCLDIYLELQDIIEFGEKMDAAKNDPQKQAEIIAEEAKRMELEAVIGKVGGEAVRAIIDQLKARGVATRLIDELTRIAESQSPGHKYEAQKDLIEPKDKLSIYRENYKVEIEEGKTFLPKGIDNLTAQNFLETNEGKQLLQKLIAADPTALPETIQARALGQLKSGITIPELKTINTPLVKIVPYGQQLSDTSPYFTTMSELDKAKNSGLSLAEYFGLPVKSEAAVYDIYQIIPKNSTSVFVSKIAPTSELGGLVERAGGATQYIVPNRVEWNVATLVGKIND